MARPKKKLDEIKLLQIKISDCGITLFLIRMINLGSWMKTDQI